MALSGRAAGFGRGSLDSPVRHRFSSHNDPFDVRSLEESQLKTEEEAVSLLQQQVAQVHQIKMENERKEAIISELRQQVSELLRFKEQAFNMKAQLSLVEERAKLRETESSYRRDELLEKIRQLEENEIILKSDVSRLEDEKIKYEESKAQMAQQLRRQQYDYEGSIRTELERWEMSKVRLENELNIALDTVEAQRETISKLNSQVRLSKENGEVISHLEMEKTVLQQERNELQATCVDLQKQLGTFQEKVQKMAKDAHLLDEYRKELTVIPTLQGEVRDLTYAQSELKEQLRVEKSSVKSLEEEKKRWRELHIETEKRLKDANLQLESQLSDVRHQLLSLSHVTKEVAEKKQQVELLTEEIARLRSTDISLANELSDLQNQYTQTCHILDVVSSEVPQELNSIYRVLDKVKSGGQVDPTEGPYQLSSALGQLRTVIQNLRNRATEVASELVSLRDIQRSTAKALDRTKTESHATEKELVELRKVVFALTNFAQL